MSKNNFDYIREAYQVPAKKGVKVIANGKQGTIIGTHNALDDIFSFYKLS